MKRILLYINQFFGQIGGEEKAGRTPELIDKIIGPGILFNTLLTDSQITHVVRCGDNYYAENMEQARANILHMIEQVSPDLVITGPAFNAGRYGVACADLCQAVQDYLHIPCLSGLYIENPAVEMYRQEITIVSVGKSAAHMKAAVTTMAGIADKLLRGEQLGFPEDEGLIPHGKRINIFSEKTAAQRAVDMLLAKLEGKDFISEIPIPHYHSVTPAEPIASLAESKIALLTSGGVVPLGNPDHLPAATAKFYKKYDISHIKSLRSGEFEIIHAGYDPVYANQNPNRIVPLDLLNEAFESGQIGQLYPYFFSTTGNSTSVSDATRMGQEIARELSEANVNGAVLTST